MKKNDLFSRDRLIKNLREWHAALSQYKKNELAIESLAKAADMLEQDKQTEFNLICERAARDVLIEEIPKWVSIKDRFPEHAKTVLCCCESKLVSVTTGWYDVHINLWHLDNDLRKPVSHWMELPEMPSKTVTNNQEK